MSRKKKSHTRRVRGGNGRSLIDVLRRNTELEREVAQLRGVAQGSLQMLEDWGNRFGAQAVRLAPVATACDDAAGIATLTGHDFTLLEVAEATRLLVVGDDDGLDFEALSEEVAKIGALTGSRWMLLRAPDGVSPMDFAGVFRIEHVARGEPLHHKVEPEGDGEALPGDELAAAGEEAVDPPPAATAEV